MSRYLYCLAIPSCDLHMGVTSLSLVLTEKGEGKEEKGEKRANF